MINNNRYTINNTFNNYGLSIRLSVATSKHKVEYFQW